MSSVIGRLPIGVTGLAILLLVQTATGSFARGGLAFFGPTLGRLIDRHGPHAS